MRKIYQIILFALFLTLSYSNSMAQTWQQVFKTGSWIDRMVFSKNTPGTVYIVLDSIPVDIVARDFSFYTMFGYGYRTSTDNGISFSDPKLSGYYILDIFEDPVNKNILLASGYKMGLSGVLKSADKGITWSDDFVSSPATYSILKFSESKANPNRIFAAAVNGTYGLLSSDNYFTDCIFKDSIKVQARDLKISRSDNRLMFLAADSKNENGVWHSKDSGEHWIKYETGLKGLRVFTVQPSTFFPGCVYCGADSVGSDGSSYGCGIYMSLDTGKNWKRLALTGFRVFSIEENPYNPKFLAAACDSGGVYFSGNYGRYWTSSNSGLPTGSSVRSVAYPYIVPDTAGASIYCTVDNKGIYKSIPVTTEVSDLMQNNFSNISIESLYPQPASSYANIIIKSNLPQNIRLYLSDLTGNCVKEIFDGFYLDSYQSLNIDTEDLTSGIYILKLEAGAAIINKKLIVNK
ncbi:MAG: T9SS type A sorting domain-containing protein [Candidatus Kapabacteria bacterium]|nr:T9SS type A sorting domain-containing protein [Candidatus Kapabacteria bacterium]